MSSLLVIIKCTEQHSLIIGQILHCVIMKVCAYILVTQIIQSKMDLSKTYWTHCKLPRQSVKYTMNIVIVVESTNNH